MLSREERETCVNFNSADKTASIYTSQSEIWRRLERLDGFKLLEEGKMDGKVVSKEFEFPKSFIRFGKRGLIISSPKTAKTLTDGQREALQKGRLRLKTLDNVQGSKTAEPSTGVLPCRGE